MVWNSIDPTPRHIAQIKEQREPEDDLASGILPNQQMGRALNAGRSLLGNCTDTPSNGAPLVPSITRPVRIPFAVE